MFYLQTQPLCVLISMFSCLLRQPCVIAVEHGHAFSPSEHLPNMAVNRVLQAVAQTSNIEKGNVQLKKAIKLSTSARKYTAVLMVVASLLVLGFDWYAS